MVIQAADIAGLSKAELVSWFTSAYVFGGLLNLILTLKYKIPFAGAHSITAAAFLGTAAAGYSFPELAGAFALSGVLILFVGCTGLFAQLIQQVPKNIIDALIAGLLLTYVLKMFPAGMKLPYAGIMAAIGYFGTSMFAKRIPPTLSALFFGWIGFCLEYPMPALPSAEFVAPTWVAPQFTGSAFLSIAVPMALLILSNDLAVAMTSLKSNQFDPPVNRSLMASGLASIVTGLFGGNAANVGGLMSALCSSAEAGPKETRYLAAVVSSVLVISFGAVSWRVIDIIAVLPHAFIALVTGFSLLGLFLKGLKSAFQDKRLVIPSLATFAIAALHLDIFGISTPVWALLAGFICNKVLSGHRGGG